jgi:hypothetical protein
MGGRGAVPDATPALPTNARQSPPIRLFAGVCSLAVHFCSEPQSLTSRHSALINFENLIKQGVAQERLPFCHPAPSRHPFGPALTAFCNTP